MGGCGSREKELREKVGFSQSDYDYALKKFSKMTKQKPGKADEYFSFEGFKQYFTENPVLAQKLYIFMRNYGGQNYVDSLTFLTVVDLFTRVSMKLQNQLKNLDIYTLFTLVSLSSPDIMQKDSFNLNNVYKISVSYSNAVKLFKVTSSLSFQELINMQSDKGDILCHDDDQAPILIINNIFENHSLLNYKAFNDKIKTEAPLICKIVKNYIAGKFVNKTLRNTLPKLDPSELMNKQLIGIKFMSFQALLNLSVPWFQKCIAINQIYEYEVDTGQQYNFNILGNCLLQAKGPNMILFRHSQKDKDGEKLEKYVFGYFSPSQWRVSPDISGNKGSFIFSIHPKFKIFSTNGQQQSKFALLVPIITKRQSQTLHSPLKQGPKQPGLGIGGSGYDHHRIWIDGKQLQASRLVEEDKTFQSGSILPEDIHLLNIDLIEIWDLQLSTVGQGTSYFKSTSPHVHFGDAEKRINQNQLRDLIITLNQQQGRNDYRRDTREFQTTNPLLPINEEEEEKQQAK
ncbi:unnamed protein product (macronuclear) [Paramecium tetraurelia]|uniref:Oxidation resistance protein 1 n=1 Tax=Paramecium tetraurelia TaxID=5888 RepID=A0CSL8_PARTE|nr:uncharacterized protein GSPATT00010057001 [Paramecium tetraurelia]CAK73785.1 unnamed protein product [Paramecium tetraurelia]|eukprot:XP_001441182.1 hypothetical protein (macronuclear) [Paramecium tetraurelia strain d4-2]